jgi:hypothetical protein
MTDFNPDQIAARDVAVFWLLEATSQEERAEILNHIGRLYVRAVRTSNPKLPEAEVTLNLTNYTNAILDRLEEIIVAGGGVTGTA